LASIDAGTAIKVIYSASKAAARKIGTMQGLQCGTTVMEYKNLYYMKNNKSCGSTELLCGGHGFVGHGSKLFFKLY
jgi:hypothetical protein